MNKEDAEKTKEIAPKLRTCIAEAQKMAQLRYKTYVRKTQEDWSE